MFAVFWLENGAPKVRTFEQNKMSEALAHCESMRQRQRDGAPVQCVTLCSENPNNVTRMGVAPAPADYAWTKRR